MAKLTPSWETWLDTAVGKRNRLLSATLGGNGFAPMIKGDNSSPPDPPMLAYGLRIFARDGGQCPPGFLMALADMFDPPAGHSGATAKIVRPKGGKAASFDAWAIGQEADELATRDGYESAIAALSHKHTCSPTTVKQALTDYRAGMAAHDEAVRDA